MKTKEKILAKALEMFNEKGIEYVGLRELAAILRIRVGNITYYFPTKDDLVNRLSLDLGELNGSAMRPEAITHLGGFLGMFRVVFENQHAYRCILLSFVHLIERNPLIAERYKHTESMRNDSIRSCLEQLKKVGALRECSREENDYLLAALALVARFWISEAVISYSKLAPEAQMDHYLKLMARMMYPYATEAGQKDIRAFL